MYTTMQSVRIATFDDGNGRYKDLPNAWKICGQPKINGKTMQGKVSLIHETLDVQIPSISQWKLQENI